MTEDFKHLDQIEAWLNDELTPEEQSAFEKRMQEDPAFKAEVDMVIDMIRSIELTGENRIREAVKQVESRLESENFFTQPVKIRTMKSETNPMRKWLAIAASLAVLIATALYFFLPKSTGPEEAFAQYYAPEKTVLPGILDRLEAPGLATPASPAEDSLAMALELYSEDRYDEARSELSYYLDTHPNDPVAHLYMGLSQLQLAEYANASTHLIPLVEDESFAYLNTAKWYLALCYTQFGTPSATENAKKLLIELAEDPDSGYYEEATGYLQLF